MGVEVSRVHIVTDRYGVGRALRNVEKSLRMHRLSFCSIVGVIVGNFSRKGGGGTNRC